MVERVRRQPFSHHFDRSTPRACDPHETAPCLLCVPKADGRTKPARCKIEPMQASSEPKIDDRAEPMHDQRGIGWQGRKSGRGHVVQVLEMDLLLPRRANWRKPCNFCPVVPPE